VAKLIPEPLAESAGAPVGLVAQAPAKKRGDGLAAGFMIGPNVTLFTVFVVVPIFGALALSFFNWNLSGDPFTTAKWVGLSNYTKMFSDPLVLISVKNTLYFVAMGVVPTVFISLGLAMLINFRFPGVSIVRSLYLVPAAVSLAASAVIWQYIYEPKFGLLSYLFDQVGLTPPINGFLSTTSYALPSLDLVCVWTTLPIGVLLYLAALQRIPASVIEAATLDGAGWFRRVRYVIWPGVSNMTLLVAIISLIAFTAGGFDLVNILTRGQPIYATETLIYYIYYTAVNDFQWGYAAALSVLQFVIIVGILVLLVAARQFLVRRS
jgi:ABC-type sugar transport system permease subunit